MLRSVAPAGTLRHSAFRAAFAATGAGAVIGVVVFAGSGIAATGQAPELTTDATGPLLTPATLTPGAVTERCVQVSYRQSETSTATVGIFASAGGSGLADYLDITIDRGTGGSYAGGCSGFAGTPTYTGTLAALAQSHGDPTTQLVLGTTAPGDGSMSFRFRVAVRDDNRAQQRSASATFSWLATTDGVDADDSPPTSTVSAPLVPTTDPGAGPSPAPDVTPDVTPELGESSAAPGDVVTTAAVETEPLPASPAAAASDEPSSAATSAAQASSSPTPAAVAPSAAPSSSAAIPSAASLPAAPSAQAAPPESSGARQPERAAAPRAPKRQGILERITAGVRSFVEPVAEAAPAALKGGAVGLGTVPFLLLFLLIQREIDKRDPKLALAPSYADAYLTFEPHQSSADEGSTTKRGSP